MNRALRNLSISTSLTGVLVLFTIIILVVGGLGYAASSLGSRSLVMLDKVNVDQLNAVNLTRAHITDTQLNLERFVDYHARGQHQQAQAYLSESDVAMQRAQERYDQYIAAPKTEQGKPFAQAIQTAYQQLTQGIGLQRQALSRNDIDVFHDLQPQVEASKAEFKRVTQDFIDYADARGSTLMANFERDMDIFEVVGLMAIIAAAAIVILVRVAMIRVMIRPLNEAVEHFEHMAQGDLSRNIADHGRNEMGKLFAAMQQMQGGLAKTVATVRNSSGSIHAGTREIASGNADLSSRTEQQAASLEQTAASMEQLTATVKQNADNARQASAMANEASTTAGRGGEVVGQVITTMHGISDSSKKIADIIGMIDSIAFQTNILALNASVEAARAGEQGRGFAVVAGEVRTLASRSAEAAKEIKTLIGASTTQIKQGATLVEDAGTTMRDVVASVKRVTDIIDEISAASQEQSEGIEQVHQAVSQMDQVTQQNASLVQEASTAAASLEEQAQRLEEAVAIFRLSAVQASHDAPPAADLRLARTQSAASTNASSTGSRRLATTEQTEDEWAEF
ncbi:methyl-accepting chemotaxis protein [Halomonas sp. WWR20]